MKVILINGSPHVKGCTYRALDEVSTTLQKNDIETEIIHLGTKPISGCLGCGTCHQTGKCVINDLVNEFVEKAKNADGFIFGSPVHYASASGMLSSFMDRLFFSRSDIFYGKPAACVVSCRRGGATATFDQINKYFSISSMPIVTSQYWNMVHGTTYAEVEQDLEGLQTMRTLANNMAYMLKCFHAGKEKGIQLPKKDPKIYTNFIR